MGGDYQKYCDKYTKKYINHDIYLQKIPKISLSLLIVNKINGMKLNEYLGIGFVCSLRCISV